MGNSLIRPSSLQCPEDALYSEQGGQSYLFLDSIEAPIPIRLYLIQRVNMVNRIQSRIVQFCGADVSQMGYSRGILIWFKATSVSR